MRLGYMTCLVPALGETAGELLGDMPESNKVALVPDVGIPFPSHSQSFEKKPD